MNLRTTLVLILLTAGGAALWVFGPKIAPHVGLGSRSTETNGAGSPATLDQQLTREKMRRIDIRAGEEAVTLEKGESGRWVLPGKWPTRTVEAEELVALLTNLHSRFQVIPLTASIDLKPFGLDETQKPIKVEIKAEAEESIRLVFGQPESAEGGPFATPTYVRINDRPEVVRLGPALLTILKRPREFYQRRQLFPDVERFKFAASTPPPSPFGQPPPPTDSGGPTLIPKAKQILAEGPQGVALLRRLADPPKEEQLVALPSDPQLMAEQWELIYFPELANLAAPSNPFSEGPVSGPIWETAIKKFHALGSPVRDRVDPERVRAALSAVPDLWVESFVSPNDPALIAGALIASPGEGFPSLMAWLQTASYSGSPAWLNERTGLDKPERTLHVTLSGNDTIVLELGKVSQVKERPGTIPPPARPGMPPMPPMPIREEYRYARLAGQPLVFEIKASKLNDLFGPAGSLRDEKLARFKTSEVSKVEIKQSGATIVLAKEKDDKKQDKWRVQQPIQALAENEKITELLDRLSGIDARPPDLIDNPNLRDAGFEPANGITVALALDEEFPGPGEEKNKRQRSVTFAFGKHDAVLKKVNVRTPGRDCVAAAPEEVFKLVERPALAYRGRRVLDFDAAKVAAIDIQNEKERYQLQQTNGDWTLAVAPITAGADKTKAGDLAFDLSRLEAVEYVNDAPKPDDLIKASLDKPTRSATVTFADATKPAEVLLVGKQREGKQDYFAKLASGTSVFAIRKELHDKLDQKSLDFRPTQLWTLNPNDFNNFRLTRANGDKYELKKDGFEWKIVAPFEAKASMNLVQPMLDTLVNLKNAGFHAHTVANPSEYGFDKPQLEITFTTTEPPKDGEKETTKTRTLILGKAVEGKPELFAKLANDPAVFKLSDATKLNVDKPALDLLERRLIGLDGRKIAKIQRVGSAAMIATKEAKDWKIDSGTVSFPADRPSIDAVLRTWEFLQAEKFADYGAKVDWAKYGLNPAVDTITVIMTADMGATPESHTLKLGNVEGGSRYARLDDGLGLALLPAAVVKELSRGHLDFVDRSLLNFDDTDLQAIRRTMKGNDLELARKNTWKIIKPSEQSADEQAMDDWVRQLARLRADRVAAYSPTDLKPFGLDAPTAVVTFVFPEKDSKPVQHVLRIGGPVDPNTPAGDRFVLVDGSKVVGVLARPDAKKLLAEPIHYRDRALVRRLAEPDKVVLERGDRAGANKVVFTKMDGTWKMTAPLPVDAEHADMEDFLNAIYKLRAEELLAERPSADKLKEFGLDKPEATWKFFVGDKEILGLIIGKKDSTDQRSYAKLATGDTVFLLDAQITSRALSEYRKRALWTNFDAAQVEMLTITGSGGNFTLRKVAGAWQIEGKPEQKLNDAAVSETLGALANLKAERFVRDKDAPLDVYGLGTPKRTIVAQTGMGMKQTLHLGNAEGGSKRLYAVVPGQTAVFVLSETDSGKLDRDLKAFMGK